MRDWTPEARARQSELVRSWKPWAQSTGPTSEEGKARSSTNSHKHGARSAAWANERRELLALLADHAAFAVLAVESKVDLSGNAHAPVG